MDTEAPAERDHGLEPAELLEYVYENIQSEAAAAIKGVRIRR